MVDVTAGEVLTDKDYGSGPGAIARKWLGALELSNKAEEKWRKEVHNIRRLYSSGEDADGLLDFNILWSNIQTLGPALYKSAPRPDVRRRYRENDETAMKVSDVIERSLAWNIDQFDFDGMAKGCIFDYLTSGRGVARVRLDRHEITSDILEEVYLGEDDQFYNTLDEIVDPDDVEEDDGKYFLNTGEEETVLVKEVAMCECVDWDDFRCENARKWEDVSWIAFRNKFTKEEAEEQFGKDVADRMTYDYTYSETDTNLSSKEGDALKTQYSIAEVWEVWDKRDREVIWVQEGVTDTHLLIEEDPLNLSQFFPIPKPPYSLKRDSMVPVPEYRIYKNQAEELDMVTERIRVITDAMRVRGIYDGSVEALATILDAEDGILIPSDNMALLNEKGGLANAVQFMPLEELAKALQQLYMNREGIKQVIFEITGLADLMRGASKASETATAQNIKAQFGSLRLGDRQQDINRFLRDLFRIMGELIVENFSVETLRDITGVDITEDMEAIFTSDTVRSYRIDIETDHTVAVDEQAEQLAASKLLTTVMQYVKEMAPLVQMGFFTKEAAVSLLLMVVRKYRGSREVEDAINKMQEMGAEGDADAQLRKLQQQNQQLQAMVEELKPVADENLSKEKIAEQQAAVKAAETQAKIESEEKIAREKMELEREIELEKLRLEEYIEKQKLKLEAARLNIQSVKDKRDALIKDRDSHRKAISSAAGTDENTSKSSGSSGIVEVVVGDVAGHTEKIRAELEAEQQKSKSGSKKIELQFDDDGDIIGAVVTSEGGDVTELEVEE